METFSALLAICTGNSPVPGEFPAQRPVTRNFDVFFDLHPNKRLSKQWWGWWFETLSCPLWRHRNDCVSVVMLLNMLKCHARWPRNAYMGQQTRPSLVQAMACRLPVPSLCMKQWSLIIYIGPWGKFQWNLNQNITISVEDNELENGGCKMAAILGRHQGVKAFVYLGATGLLCRNYR